MDLTDTAQEKPAALRLCHALYTSGGKIAIYGFAVSLIIMFILLPFAGPYALILGVTGCLVTILFLVACTLLRVVVVAFFFARYSMKQLLGISLLCGLLGTLTKSLPDPWFMFPACTLVGLFFYFGIWILEQDPAGDNQKPDFFKEAVARQEASRPLSTDPSKE